MLREIYDSVSLAGISANAPVVVNRPKFDFWDELGVFAVLFLALLFFLRLRGRNEDGVSVNRFFKPRLSDPKGRIVTSGNVRYAVESFDGVSTTVWIGLRRTPADTLEVLGPDTVPEGLSVSRRAPIEVLHELGVDYIDVGHSSSRLAARLSCRAWEVEDEVAAEIVSALLALYAHSRPR